jgi:hypothetical protein
MPLIDLGRSDSGCGAILNTEASQKRTEAACSSEHTEQNGGVGHAVLECDLRELVVGQNRKTSAPHAEAVDAADNRGQWRAEPEA